MQKVNYTLPPALRKSCSIPQSQQQYKTLEKLVKKSSNDVTHATPSSKSFSPLVTNTVAANINKAVQHFVSSFDGSKKSRPTTIPRSNSLSIKKVNYTQPPIKSGTNPQPLPQRQHKTLVKLVKKSSNDVTHIKATSSSKSFSPLVRVTSTVAANNNLLSRKFTYKAPDSFATSNNDQLYSDVALLRSSPTEKCAICLEDMKEKQKIVCLNVKDCNHTFHQKCIDACLKITPKCPICRKYTTAPQGKSPSGTLDVSVSTDLCSSYESTTTQTIVLKYSMQSGIQKTYHENSGKSFSGTERVAYIPNIPDGRKLLNRLIYAFTKGLTFTIGTSLTSGKQNAITWSSIHHKTRLSGGVSNYGWPDAGYFINCNEELDALGVPTDPPEYYSNDRDSQEVQD